MFTTIGLSILGLFGNGWTDKAGRIVGILASVVLVVAVLGIGKCSYDKGLIEDHEAQREADASLAREEAADQRLEDQIANAKTEEELHDVINAAPGGSLSPAAHALACKRLSNIGRVPAACGPQGGDGGQARPD